MSWPTTAGKSFVRAGMVDGDGKVAGAGHVGYYYAWFKRTSAVDGGKKGFIAGRFQIRPSNERIKAPALTWFMHSSRCGVLATGFKSESRAVQKDSSPSASFYF